MKVETQVILLGQPPTKQPVGIQALRGFGKTLDKMCLDAEINLLRSPLSMPVISTH